MNEEKKPPQTSIDVSFFGNQLVKVSEVHLNVSQEVVITTEDKIRICLSEHLKRMGKKNSWIAPLGICTTIIITLVTSTFKDVVLGAPTWQAIFIITGIISLVWFFKTCDESSKSVTVEDIVSELKKGSQIKTKPDSTVSMKKST